MLLGVDGAASGHPASVSLDKRLTRKKRGLHDKPIYHQADGYEGIARLWHRQTSASAQAALSDSELLWPHISAESGCKINNSFSVQQLRLPKV